VLLVVIKDKAYVRDVITFDDTSTEITDALKTCIRNQLLAARRMRPSEFIDVYLLARPKRRDV
jgi:hypothetical protein